MERVAKATAHLIPVKLDEPDADKYPLPDVTSKCPLPQCTVVMPLTRLRWHFAERMSFYGAYCAKEACTNTYSIDVHCYENCPGCGRTFVNAHIFIQHIKACVCISFEEAKVAHGMRKERALVHRTAMRFKEAMDEFRPEPIEGGQGGNGERLPRNLPPQNLALQNVPPQNNGPGLIYAATHDTTTLDQVIGLIGPDTTANQAQQQQTWVQPEFLHPHSFGPTPGPSPGSTPGATPMNTMPPPPLPPPRPVEAPQFTPNVMLPLMTESDFIMEDPSGSSQHNPN